jgi:PAS domain S-box-containing protein
VTVNPAGQALLGLRPGEASGLPYGQLLDPGERRRVGAAIEEALAARRSWRGALTGLTRAGQRFPAHLSIACVFDAQREVIGTVGVLRDLTEQVATQQRLIQREKLASLGEMAAGVAHEIRNPLGGIKMATALLASGAVDGGAISREMVHTILSGIAEIDAIITDLLDYARDTRLDRQEYPLGRILGSVVDASDAEGALRGVDLVTRGLERDLVALVDGQRLRQAIANVLRNALEAVERRPRPRVEVRLYPRGPAAVVEVADNGSGISPEHREKLFLPFFTTKPTGTGLGMAIVKKIMDLHGGEIEIDSAPGYGTTVRLVIPHASQPEPVRASEESLP